MTFPAPDFIVQITATGTAHYTESFQAPDKVGILALVENNTATSTGALTLTPQHSNDGGRTWLDKTALTLSPSGTAAGNAVTPMFGADDGSVPNMRLMRLKLSITSITPSIRLFVNGRTY